jgi:thioredoxin 1
MAEKLSYASPEEFENELIASTIPCLVDFYADWCGPCRMLAPEIEELKKEYGDRLTVMKVNTDLHPDLATHFGVRGIPTVILFANGKAQWHKVGFKRGFLRKKIAEYIKDQN